MNLTKALKLKKKLVKQCNDYFTKFQSNNSIDINQQELPDYDPEHMYTAWCDSVEKLVELKTKINTANQPIVEKIFKLGELKNMAQNMRRVDTKSGKSRVSPYGTELTEYKSWLNKVDVDNIVTELEEKIEQIQEEIEAFNAITKI